jgi:XTP/dITP diphosphohydrolase
MQLVCASANPDKVAEITALLDGAVDLRPRPSDLPDVVEDADTLEGNARLKAVAVGEATGLPAVADDTGLFVDALAGAPGVWTARYAGEGATYAQNCAKLVDALAAIPDGPGRAAAFRTVVLVRWPSGEELVVEGVCPGRIATALRPGRGFGYDPLFVPDEGDGRSFSEMTADEKNAISHRGRAFAALLAALRSR